MMAMWLARLECMHTRKYSRYHRDNSLAGWQQMMDKAIKTFCDEFGAYKYDDGTPAFSINSPYIHIEQAHLAWCQVFLGSNKETNCRLMEKKHQIPKAILGGSNGISSQKTMAIAVWCKQ
jgi:hypothetical protein